LAPDDATGIAWSPGRSCVLSRHRITGAALDPPDGRNGTSHAYIACEAGQVVDRQRSGENEMATGPTVRYEFEGKVWFYMNPNAVYFVSLPEEMSADILDLVGTDLNPWGTVPCEVTINDFTWASSMFPRKDRGCYDLPLNARVRKRLKLEEGQIVSVTIEIPLPI
jgi:hypothetical protein